MEEKKSGIKKFFEEFKAFAMRGNVLDMAVGVVIGGAFTAIVTDRDLKISRTKYRAPMLYEALRSQW